MVTFGQGDPEEASWDRWCRHVEDNGLCDPGCPWEISCGERIGDGECFEKMRGNGICDECGGELYKRPDDNKETIFKRMQVYENETAPLKGFYEREGNLKTMPGQGTVDEVFSRVCALVS